MMADVVALAEEGPATMTMAATWDRYPEAGIGITHVAEAGDLIRETAVEAEAMRGCQRVEEGWTPTIDKGREAQDSMTAAPELLLEIIDGKMMRLTITADLGNGYLNLQQSGRHSSLAMADFGRLRRRKCYPGECI